MSMFRPTSILLFEKKAEYNLYPFSVMHPSWELRVGMFTLYEKWRRQFPEASLAFHGRPLHATSFRERMGIKHEAPHGSVLALQANVVPNTETLFCLNQAIQDNPSSRIVFRNDKTLIGMWIPAEHSTRHEADVLSSLPTDGATIVDVRITLLHHVWDALTLNARSIQQDIELAAEELQAVTIPAHATAMGDDDILCNSQPTLYPGVILDTTDGPIVFGSNVKVMHHSVVMGPAFIGNNSTIKSGAKIYPECSFGPWCKVGGEVENTIFQGYSNKQHDGFMGHSFISEWVNIGADTNTSDLKNNYGNIRVHMGNHEVDTGRMFLGFLCGDHTKTAINTQLNTGTICGVSTNIFADGFPPKFIPSFSWGGTEHAPPYSIDRALQTAARVMSRRDRSLLSIEETILRREYESQAIHY